MPEKKVVQFTVIKQLEMAKLQNFPLEDLRNGLEKLHSSFERAEGRCSKDKELTDSIKQAKETVSKAHDKLKSDQ